MSDIIRILMVDDYPLFRDGARVALEAEQDVQWLGFVDHGGDAHQLIRQLEPTVLLYCSCPFAPLDLSHLESITRDFPSLRILIMVDDVQAAEARVALRRGAHGAMLKNEPSPALAPAVRAVHAGRRWVSAWMEQHPVHTDQRLAALTARELEVLTLVACGWDNPAIAAELRLSPQSVRNYVTRIYQKIEVSSRAEAILFALERRLGAQRVTWLHREYRIATEPDAPA